MKLKMQSVQEYPKRTFPIIRLIKQLGSMDWI